MIPGSLVGSGVSRLPRWALGSQPASYYLSNQLNPLRLRAARAGQPVTQSGPQAWRVEKDATVTVLQVENPEHNATPVPSGDREIPQNVTRCSLILDLMA